MNRVKTKKEEKWKKGKSWKQNQPGELKEEENNEKFSPASKKIKKTKTDVLDCVEKN